MLTKEIPGCSDKLYYVKNIELRELAVREREPKVYTNVVSYGGVNFPEVIDVSGASRE